MSQASSSGDLQGDVVHLPKEGIDAELTKLKKAREDEKKKAKTASKVLRNLTKKKSRLISKAKLLSSNDLLSVYAIRKEYKEKKDKKQKDNA